MDADLDTLCPWCIAQPTTCCRGQACRVGSPTPSWSRSASPGDHGHPPTVASWPSPQRLGHLFRLPPRRLSSAAAAWPTRSSGSWASSPAKARASMTTFCSAIRPRWSAQEPRDGQALGPGRGRRLRLLRRPLALLLGLSPPPAGRADGTPRAFTLADPAVTTRGGAHAPRALPARHPRGVRLRQGLRRERVRRCVGELGMLVVRLRRLDEPVEGLRRRRSASASSGSSGPARTCSPSSATGRAPWRDCASGCRGSSAWRPASASTTAWAGRAGLVGTA